jgi:CelD/BcsL family acetyltransferase involved in cellulose biosynthesis
VTTAPVATRLEFGTLERIEDFDELRPEWNALVRAMPRPSPFLLHEWLSTWWRWWQHYGERAELSVHVARRGDRLVGAVPLMIRPHLGLQVARFIGGSERVGALADLMLAPDEVPDVAVGLADQIASSGADLVDLYGLPARSRVAGALRSEIEVIARVEAPVLDLTPGWDAVYQAKTSSKKRNFHRRRRRQLASLGRLEVAVARTRHDLASALDEAFRLHALRWQGRPDGSGFVTPVGKRFHRAAIDLLAELDVPRIVLLKLDGRAIAFHYYLVLEGRMYVHRLGFDPELARLSPGLVNTLDAIEAAAAEGVTRVEFLGGAERYKVELADGFEPLCHGLGLASGVRSRAVVAAQLGLIRLRLRLKRSHALHRLYLDRLAPLRRRATRPRHTLRA